MSDAGRWPVNSLSALEPVSSYVIAQTARGIAGRVFCVSSFEFVRWEPLNLRRGHRARSG